MNIPYSPWNGVALHDDDNVVMLGSNALFTTTTPVKT